MKLQEARSGIGRLRRLLATSGAGVIGSGGSRSHSARQACSERSAIEDDSPPRKGRVVNDGLCLTSFAALFPSRSSVSSGHSWLPSSLCYASSSAHVFHDSLRVSAASFATFRGRLAVDEEEEVRGQDEEQASNLRKRSPPETSPSDISHQKGLQGQLSGHKLSASEATVDRWTPGTDGNNNDTTNRKVPVELGWRDVGWTREEVLNWPNAISMARLVSGPLLAWMIVHELWTSAFLGLVIAGISDWADGYVARRMDIKSVLGSYLDPIADKFLIGSVAAAMAYSGLLHPTLVGLIVARDGGLMGGAFVYRAYSLGWKWNGWREFLKISIGGAGKVEPLFISKVNTVLQLALVAVALLHPALSVEDTWALVPLLSWSVVGTTSLSGIAYLRTYLKNPGALAALQHVAHVPGEKASKGTPTAR